MPSKSAKLDIHVDAETKGAIRDLDNVADAVGDISAAAADASGALDSIAAGAANAAEAAGDSFGGIVPVFDVSAVLGAVTDLAVKAGEVFSDKMSDAMDFELGRDKLQGQLGATAEEAERLGQLAGDVYSEAFGESLDQVNEAVRRVVQNLDISAFDPALKDLTSGVLDIVNTFETDMQTTTQALGNLFKTGLVSTPQAGLDLLVRGFQEGADSADDFLDSIIEFSTDFRQIGLSGAQSVGLMIQALKNGARDTDKLTDALAEWRKLAARPTQAVSDAYKKLGLDVENVRKAIGRGGEESAKAFKDTLDAIRQLEEPADRLAAVADLFGTPAEDLAQAFTNIDLSKAVEELGAVEGAAKNLSTTVGSNAATTWEAFKRSTETNLIQFLADNVVPALTVLGTHAQGVFKSMGTAWDAFMQGFRGEGALELTIEDGNLQSSISAVEGMAATEHPMLTTMRELGEEFRKFTDEWGPRVVDAWKAIQTEVEKTGKWFQDNKETMELLATIATGVLVVALLLVAGAMALVATTAATIAGAILVLTAPIVIVSGILWRFGKDWFDVFNWIWETVQRFGRMIGGVIEEIEDQIAGLIDLFKRLTSSNPLDWVGDFQLPGIPRSVAPSALTTGLGVSAFATSSRRPAPVYNVTIAHSGLAVDSPRLQREIVDALRRYEKREGSLRGLIR